MAIARVALPVAVDKAFDYWIPDGLAVVAGALVRVDLAGRPLAGVVVDVGEGTDAEPGSLVPLREVVTDLAPLPPDVLALAGFVADYYQAPLGQVLALALPPLGEGGGSGGDRRPQPMALTARGQAELPARLARAPRARDLYALFTAAPGGILDAEALQALPESLGTVRRAWVRAGWIEPAASPTDHRAPRQVELNAEQGVAVAAIDAAADGYQPLLLQGITGSGKTDVYLAAAATAIARGRQVLLLVPEINLTPQFERRVRAALPTRRLVTLHSALSAGERRRRWQDAAAGRADLVLGTRLAVFTPLPRLGLVVVDEEHDPSFKQQDLVRYHARDVAIWRARDRGVPCVLGTATPALESLHRAQQGRYTWLRLSQRAVAPAVLPPLRLVPDRSTKTGEGMGEPLQAAIAARLARGEQSLVFINRRGYAPALLCSACGWQPGCPGCSARLVVHRDDRLLRCHHCGHAEAMPRHCPECGNVDLLPLGHGTQRLERSLAEVFPTARIARIDRDSMRRKGSFDALHGDIHAGEIDILVGTQMLAKGHDFPRLTLVGILGADNALYSADFRATERLAALLLQVAGRAGRAQLPGEVIVQTSFPTHPLFVALADHDYDAIAATLLAERRVAGLPPFAHLALLAAEAPDRTLVDDFLGRAHAAGEQVLAQAGAGVELFSPVAASLARRAGMERGQILVRCDHRAVLQRFLARWRSELASLSRRRLRWSLDVDPIGFA
jgi:primosomal protein N' (replication factor Y)